MCTGSVNCLVIRKEMGGVVGSRIGLVWGVDQWDENGHGPVWSSGWLICRKPVSTQWNSYVHVTQSIGEKEEQLQSKQPAIWAYSSSRRREASRIQRNKHLSVSGTWLVGHTQTQTQTHRHTHTHTLISRVQGPWESVLVEKSDVILYYLT